MHLPDGFLSPPVWGALDAVAVVSVAVVARRSNAPMPEAPLLGVMGAFVFAAQMINFPVGAGTSGHLLGGALLAVVLGPRTATMVMTAVLLLQALVFQDGGILALGANVFNMAIAGVWIGYFAYRAFGAFAGAALSMVVTAALALAELLLSGVPLSKTILSASAILFLLTGLIEGAITIAVLRALKRMNPAFIRPVKALPTGSLALAALALFIAVGLAIASPAPDVLESTLSIEHTGQTIWSQRAAAGVGGMLLIFLGCTFAARRLNRST